MLSFLDNKYKYTTLHSIAYCGLLAGVGVSAKLAAFTVGEIALTSLCVLFLFYKRNILCILAIFSLLFMLGACRGQNLDSQLAPYRQNYQRQVVVSAKAVNDAVYGNKKQLTFDVNSVRLNGDHKLPGKIKVSGFGVNTILAGDEVILSGKLMPSYGQYEGRISFAKVSLIAHKGTYIDGLRREFSAGMQTSLPEPQSAFAMGILVGQRSNLPESIRNAFLMVGLTHIVAVSGYNLTIIINALQKFSGGSSRRMTIVSISIFATAFVLLAGAGASIVRAYIVSMLSLIAGYYGRKFKPLNLILFVATITALTNPRNIWTDMSWYLSFLAFFGVLVLSPAMGRLFSDRFNKSILLGVALESVCAEIMCLPLILHVFGQMSFIGLLANVLVVPLIPLAMLLSFAAGMAGMLNLWIVGWAAIPAKILLNYLLAITQNLSNLPHIFTSDVYINLPIMILSYLIIIIVSLRLNSRYNSSKYDIITDKNERSQQMVHN